MLFSRSIFTISCVAFSIVTAIPIQPDTQKLFTESLTEYYETIVDQTMYDVADSVLFYIPESSSHGDTQARENAERSLDRNINFMRASLMASIYPLVLTDTSMMKNFDSIQNRLVPWAEGDPEQEDLEDVLLNFIFALNKRISHQLGLIVNANESSKILMKQAVHQSSEDTPTVITVEWQLRKPFQVHIVREQQDSDLAEYDEETKWLYQQLAKIQDDLLTEFDEQTDEALQIIKDTLSFNL